MTLPNSYSFLIFATLTFLAFSCSVTNSGLTKKRIVIKRNHTYVYKITVPKGDTRVSKILGGHGNSFSIQYIDNSMIYFTDDMNYATPNYFDNYKTIGFKTPVGGLQTDTSISGLQTNGRYWKEIFHGGYYLGYKNVSKDKLELFNKSIQTFSRKR